MDIDFASLVGTAGDASGLLKNALTSFAEFRKLAKDGKLPPEAGETILTLSTQLSEAQVKLAHLETEIMKIERAQDAFDEIRRRKRNYVLTEITTGVHAYRLRADVDSGEPPHEVCPDCFERDQIRVLQRRGPYLWCNTCDARLPFQPRGFATGRITRA